MGELREFCKLAEEGDATTRDLLRRVAGDPTPDRRFPLCARFGSALMTAARASLRQNAGTNKALQSVTSHVRDAAARAAAEGRAIDYARALRCPQVNCLAGIAPNGVAPDKVRATFVENLRYAAQNMGLTGWLKWRRYLLPAIFPSFVTGAITASGGSWNASIVAEVASWGDTKLKAAGLGAYIAEATKAGDYRRVVLGIGVMSVLVVSCNRTIWRPLYRLAERRYRLT